MNRQHILSGLCSFLLFGFLLGIHDGQIALWKDQDPIPCKIIPCPVSALPAHVQTALKKGIPIDSMEDFEKLIEKYLP